MWITSIGTYLPSEIRDNAHYSRVNGLPEEYIAKSAGIRTRHVAAVSEDACSMALAAARDCLSKRNGCRAKPDLIISGSYTPADLIGTIAHRLQRALGLNGARALYVSTACCSMVNAVEIAEGYFATGKSEVCLATASEHNSGYSDDSDPVSGHLWGDGAGAFLLSANRPTTGVALRVVGVTTHGHGADGKGPGAITMRPHTDGLTMPFGKDVFRQAIRTMCAVAREMLDLANLPITAIRYFVPHQANQRITDAVAERLSCQPCRVVSNIARYGNTGSAGFVIALASVAELLEPGDYALVAVFGGGYSSGGMLLQAE